MSTPTLERAADAAPPRRGGRTAALALAMVAVLVVFALAVVGGGQDEDATGTAAPGEVAATGDALPSLEDPAADPAVGLPAPRIAGADFDGTAVAAPVDGEPTILLFLAHWCPACQQEVPSVQGWLDAGNEHDGVALRAVSTGVDPARDNHPPEDWFAREGWTVPTIVDDDASSAARAFGLPGYPYWVFVDADGTVLGRHVGVLATGDLERVVEHLRGPSG